MPLEKISFLYNWNNKLSCNVFTTVRIKNDRKYRLNDVYEITLTSSKDKTPIAQGNAQIVLIHDFLLSKTTEGISLIDTGYIKEKFIELVKTMYKNAKINFDTQLF